MQIKNIPINTDRKELTVHGSYAFPFSIYKTIPSKNVLGFIDWHWHDEVQFCIVKKKSIQVSINQEKITLNAGDGIFINKACLHKITSFDKDSLYFAFMINVEIIYGFRGSLLESDYVSPICNNKYLPYCTLLSNIDWQNDILNILNNIDTLYSEKNPGYEFNLIINLLQIWKLLFFNLHLVNTKSSDSYIHTANRLKQIYNFIHENYQRKITLDDIALNLHISKNECCRFFKKYTGSTLFEYLTTFRIIKSIELLQDSNLTITEIALSVGFTSSSYYIDKFYKYTGFTPLKYRKFIQNIN